MNSSVKEIEDRALQLSVLDRGSLTRRRKRPALRSSQSKVGSPAPLVLTAPQPLP